LSVPKDWIFGGYGVECEIWAGNDRELRERYMKLPCTFFEVALESLNLGRMQRASLILSFGKKTTLSKSLSSYSDKQLKTTSIGLLSFNPVIGYILYILIPL
jgi:hypothetical protein